MKGMCAILGCLFAAYAAPLFANEVPLILEETIQLPIEPEAWDVAKTGDDEYTWVVGERSTFYVNHIWGTTTLGIVDTFLHGAHGPAAHGWPKHIEIYKTLDDSLRCFVLSSYSGTYCSLGSSLIDVLSFDLVTGRDIGHRWAMSYCDRPPNIPGAQCRCFYEIKTIGATPPYPFATQGIQSVESFRRYNLEGDRTPNYIYPTVFGGAYWIDANVLIAEESQWAWQPYIAVVDYDSEFCQAAPNGCPIVRKYVIEGDSAYSASDWESVEQTPEECLRLLCSWDESIQSAIVILQTPDSLKAWSDTSETTVWRARSRYEIAFLADAVSILNGEELLVAEPQFSLLHIRSPGSFSFWGQTSRIDTGFDEIRVIGRYHNEYRRLVVRYGSDLRIYRFGDPIYTDADDARPELPQELTLTAYPNPFNPTTMLAFDLPKTSRASLIVYDLTGRQVQTLFDERMSAGHHEIGFDGAALPSGIYFARLKAGHNVLTHKLVLLK